jgi:hypothetical protein
LVPEFFLGSALLLAAVMPSLSLPRLDAAAASYNCSEAACFGGSRLRIVVLSVVCCSQARAKVLAEEFQWDLHEARKIWTFGLEAPTRCNLLVDMTRGALRDSSCCRLRFLRGCYAVLFGVRRRDSLPILLPKMRA